MSDDPLAALNAITRLLDIHEHTVWQRDVIVVRQALQELNRHREKEAAEQARRHALYENMLKKIAAFPDGTL